MLESLQQVAADQSMFEYKRRCHELLNLAGLIHHSSALFGLEIVGSGQPGPEDK